jgi:hypothetical protein
VARNEPLDFGRLKPNGFEFRWSEHLL